MKGMNVRENRRKRFTFIKDSFKLKALLIIDVERVPTKYQQLLQRQRPQSFKTLRNSLEDESFKRGFKHMRLLRVSGSFTKDVRRAYGTAKARDFDVRESRR